jgi:ABC-type sugar transport system substrate-binding protein
VGYDATDEAIKALREKRIEATIKQFAAAMGKRMQKWL